MEKIGEGHRRTAENVTEKPQKGWAGISKRVKINSKKINSERG